MCMKYELLITSFNNDNTAKLGNKRNCRKISFFTEYLCYTLLMIDPAYCQSSLSLVTRRHASIVTQRSGECLLSPCMYLFSEYCHVGVSALATAHSLLHRSCPLPSLDRPGLCPRLSCGSHHGSPIQAISRNNILFYGLIQDNHDNKLCKMI